MSNNSSEGSAEFTRKIVDDVHFIVLAVLIVAVNSSVIALVWKRKVLHKWQNYLLVSLAFSDLSTGLFGLPAALACTVIRTSNGCIFCSVSYTFTKFISISTILHLLTNTYERFLSIVHPMRHMSGKHVPLKFVLVGIWTVSLTVAALPFTWMDPTNCVGDDAKHWFIWLAYNATTLILFLVIPMILFILAFVSMFLVVRAHIRKRERARANRSSTSENPRSRVSMSLRKEVRVAVIFALMWIIFVICWSPYFALSIPEELEKETHLHETLVEAANVLRFLTSLLNPLLYSFAKNDFSQALRSRTRLTRYN